LAREQFATERDRYAEALRGASSVDGYLAALDILVDRAGPEWLALLSAFYVTTGRSAAELVYSDLLAEKARARGPFLDAVDQRVLSWLGSHAATRVVGINNATRRAIRKSIAAGVEAGEGIDAIASRLEALYLKQIIAHRTEVIARTETTQAFNLGSREAAKETGLDLRKQWLTAHDERTRSAHAHVDGQERHLDEPYNVDGDELLYPGDTSMGAKPGNTIQCRCSERYVKP
jgi:hypothetical protein